MTPSELKKIHKWLFKQGHAFTYFNDFVCWVGNMDSESTNCLCGFLRTLVKGGKHDRKRK